jgi:putative peptidoglycan lipid II flippase
MNSSKKFLTNTLKLAFSIFINKPIGLLRDILKARYFGVGVIGDAFSMAWRIPNALRRIFGEGALSSVLVPILVDVKEKHGENEMNSLITFIFLSMQLIIVCLCIIISIKAKSIITLIAPGALGRVDYAVSMIQVMIFFTLFMSGSAILGGALQIKGNFSIGPISQFFLNIALCIEFLLCIKYNLNFKWISWFIFLNGIIILLMHIYAYKKNKLMFLFPTLNTIFYLKLFFKRAVPAIATSGIVDLNMIIDGAVASYLPIGSQSMLDYISGFIRVPLQVFGSSFATVSAPEFAKIVILKKNRIKFYIFEAAKLMLFFSTISIFFIYFFAYKLLYTLLLSNNFSIENVKIGSGLLCIFSFMLFFSMFNKVLVNVFYAYQNVVLPTLISIISSALNTFINIIFIFFWGNIFGVAVAMVFSETTRTIILLYFIDKKLKINFNYKKFLDFFILILKQILFMIFLFLVIYYFLYNLIYYLFGSFLLESIFYWVWVLPIILLILFLIFKTKKKFNIRLFYLKI